MASRRSEDGGIVRSPISSKTSTIALEKAALVIRAKPGVNKVGVEVQECLLTTVYW